jgi:O-antigen/teichoic acid export membrane protein
MTDALAGEAGQPGEEVWHHVRRMFGRDSVYMALWAVQLGAAALFTPINTRLLGVSRYGRVAAAAAVMQVLYAIGNLQLQGAIQRRYEHGGEDQARRLVAVAVVLAVAIDALVYLTGPLWSRALGFGSFGGAAKWAVLWGGFVALTTGSLGLLKSKDRLGPFTTVTLLQSVGAQALAITLVLTVDRRASTFVFGLMLGQAAAAAVALLWAPPKRAGRRQLPLARAALSYSIPLVPGAVASFALSVADRLILQSKLGPVPVGRYQVAYNLGSLSITLLGAMNVVWMPRIFAIRDERTRGAVLATSRDSLYRVLLPGVAGLSIGAPLLLLIWTPPSYRRDGLLLVVTIVAASALPYASSLAHTRVLLAAGKTWSLAWTIVVAAAVNVALNLVLIPVWGLTGSATATLISYVLLAGLIRHEADRCTKLTAPPTSLLWQIGLVTAATFAWSQAPTSSVWLGIRSVLAVGCVGWMFVVGKQLVRPTATPRSR